MSDLFVIDSRGGADDVAGPELVGAKAHGLMRLARLGLPVPPGFVLGTGLCAAVVAGSAAADRALRETLTAGIRWLEQATGAGFGSRRRPLLVSVRSGGAVSMPGMMETILDVGLTPVSRQGLIRATGNPRLAWDADRRLVQGFATTVHACPAEPFEQRMRQITVTAGGETAAPDSMALAQLAEQYRALFHSLTGAPFPADPMEQLVQAAAAVFRSSQSAKAAEYRRLQNIAQPPVTAVTVQAMVFGNAGGTSGAGVGFTRDPTTGENRLYLDFLFNAQGEDVVSGRRVGSDVARLPHVLPAVWAELERVRRCLETSFGDLQDFEFTVQEGRLFLLQTRPGKRTPWAAVQVAVDLVHDGIIDRAQALQRLASLDLDQVERCVADADKTQSVPLARAIAAGAGVAVGHAAFDVDRARALAASGVPVILVRQHTVTEDVAGFAIADGILTATGSQTSHAAVVARQLGKVCLVGCSGLRVDSASRQAVLEGTVLHEGDALSLDGLSGQVYAGCLRVRRERPDAALAEIARWRAEAAWSMSPS
ncbi:MAG: PEP/pyruvate-binding domain-containing protein [Azospirillaceae bacterium]|nr:PEP/pyruvate-binding domain-containing protein [Azospirillaceae bacterium]